MDQNNEFHEAIDMIIKALCKRAERMASNGAGYWVNGGKSYDSLEEAIDIDGIREIAKMIAYLKNMKNS